tara:strand:+ start:796 stop:1392 length:597 start_codon:yes stop_codon:yes gene_type:complete
MNLWKSIKNIVKSPKENKWTAEKDAVYFHEDSYRQVEICPIENLSYLKKQNFEIGQFADNHSDGIGYTEIYEREENPISIYDKKIPFSELDELLISLGFEKKTKVYEGYGSTSWRCENTFAYEMNRALIFIYPEGEFVKDFWVDNFRFEKDKEIIVKLKNGLLKIGTEYDLVLNDWNLTMVFDLRNESEIENYLCADL